ncbi:hypothetical protein [Qiania dongpingensis]|uniref:TFIIB-type zinc ribbon-containing protein n=1 Tax=Qiania dongpingensis TaxID=2763669 RepID=A0A7G9G7F2_9FIRM|nr:hypothetical protein [Qiania dongpingensis]QNM06734.1 hypothetical protein H9Q78_06360 [Qiania dongpingensis]
MIVIYKCPGCGAPMKFDPECQTLACEHCGTQMGVVDYQEKYGAPAMREETEQEKSSLAQGKTVETEVQGSRVERKSGETMQVKKYRCSSCGAEVMTDETSVAAICSFCGNSTLIEERLEGEKKPEQLIPFRITKEQAVESFREWTKTGRLTPKGFKDENKLDQITGIYVPFWLVDYNANIRVDAHCTKKRKERSGGTEYFYTDHFCVCRDVEARYERVPLDASEKMDDASMDLLEPFDYKELKPFDVSYLSGYTAESYSLTEENMEERGKKRIREYADAATKNIITGYDKVEITERTMQIDEIGAEYVLLPVWVLNYSYKGKNQQFFINGQTGKVVGSLPVSKAKKRIWFASWTAVIFALLWLVMEVI